MKATWVEGTGCAITHTNNKVLAAIFIYSMCFDLVVLLLNTYKLLRLNSHGPGSFGRSRLTHMMCTDGLVYFLIAYVFIFSTNLSSISRRYVLFSFLANLIATVLMILNLNPIMSIIFNVPAAVASTVRLASF